jgi:hypothetical protein
MRKDQEARFPECCRALVAVAILAAALAVFTGSLSLNWIEGLLIGLAALAALVALKKWRDELTWRSLRDRELALMDEMQRTAGRAATGFRRSTDIYPQHHQAGLSG